jgi:hypothetical protein
MQHEDAYVGSSTQCSTRMHMLGVVHNAVRGCIFSQTSERFNLPPQKIFSLKYLKHPLREETCPIATLSTANFTWTGLELNPDLRSDSPAA